MAKSAPKRASNPTRVKKYETQKSRTEANKKRNREANEARAAYNRTCRENGQPTPVQIKTRKRLAKREIARGKVTPLNVQRAWVEPKRQTYERTEANIKRIMREAKHKNGK